MLTLVLASACFLISGAQQQQPPVFRGETDLAHLDVMVTGKDGQHVAGLTKDDFELYLNHARVTVDVLAENRHTRGESAAGRRDVVTNETAQGDRIVMLVLDDLHIPKEHTDVARDAAERLVKGIGGRAEVGVLFTSGQPGLEFTRDTDLLLDTVRKFRGNQNPFKKVEASTWPGPLQHLDPANRPGGGGDPAGPTRSDMARDQAENDLFWSTMQGALDKLPKHDGRRKALVILSEGNVVSSAAGQLANTPSALDTDYSAAIPEVGMYTSSTPGGANRLLGNFIQSVRRTETSVYAIDPRGKATMGQEGYASGSTFLNDGDIARQ
ncbi:MAG: VWA domain-containing protein, partial [Sciscionella sp.]